MPHNRYFIDSHLLLHEQLILKNDEAHHLQKVMRKKVGEIVELVNGNNVLAFAEILAIEKNGVQLCVREVQKNLSPAYEIILCQAIPRLNRLDIIVEKGVELGMTALWLFPGFLSEKKEIKPQQLERLKAISIAAMKQCGRLDLPKISLKPALNKWNAFDYPAYFGDLSKTAPPFLSQIQSKKQNIMFFVGPESGFSQQEELHLRKLGATGISLHSHTLRTDTAPLVALSLICCS